MRNLIIVDSAIVPSKYIKLACSKMGINPIFIGLLSSYPEEIQNHLRELNHISVKTGDMNRLVEEVGNFGVKDICGVTSLYECGLEAAIMLAKLLNVPGPDSAVLRLRNKYEVTKMIPEFSLPAYSCPVGEFQATIIETWLNTYDAIIIKPVSGAGGAGNKIIQRSHFGYLQDIVEKSSNSFESGIIIQPVFNGTLYSLEGYVRSGETVFLGLSKRSRVANTEVANYFPFDQSIPDRMLTTLKDAVKALVKRSGFRNGYFHAEFLSNHEKSYLIDANFGRIGGSSVIEQVAFSFGLEPDRILQHILDLTLFQSNSSLKNMYNVRPVDSLGISYGLHDDGCFEYLNLPNQMTCYHTTMVRKNSQMARIGCDDDSWIGTIAGSPQKVLEEIDQIRIKTESGLLKPYYVE